MMDYLKARGKLMIIGFVVGAPIGYFSSYFNGQAHLETPERLFLSFQIGVAFGVLALVGYNYLEFRRRLKKHIEKSEKK